MRGGWLNIIIKLSPAIWVQYMWWICLKAPRHPRDIGNSGGLYLLGDPMTGSRQQSKQLFWRPYGWTQSQPPAQAVR